MIDPTLQAAIAAVPAGRWAVGVSGGADSVALLSLLLSRDDLSLHIVHLDHQTRGEQSTADANFVADLASQWNIPVTISRLDQIEPSLKNPPTNPSARYRAARLMLFRKVVQTEKLDGVILAHHANDQAETVLHRLLRNAPYAGLAAMSFRTMVNDLVILRPLLGVRRETLRKHLSQNQIAWREDASNQSPKYLRNRLRKLLAAQPRLVNELLELSTACAHLRDWSRGTATVLDERFKSGELATMPKILASESARRWLIARGVPAREVQSNVIERLLAMAADAATAPRVDFPGNVRIRRRGGIIFVERES